MQTQSTSPSRPPSLAAGQLLVVGWVMLGGIVAWFAHLNLMYFLVQPVCRLGGTWTFHVASAALLAIALLTGFRAWRLWSVNRNESQSPDQIDRRHSILAFAGGFGMAIAAMAALAIVAQWIPVFVIGPCG